MAGNTVVINIIGRTKGLQKSLAQANQSLGGLQRISQSLGGAFKVAAIGAAAFGAAAVGGAAIGAAALLGLGGGVLALGIKFAAMDKRVSGAFGNLKKNVSTSMQELSKPFVEPLIRSAAALQGAFNTLKPAISTVFTQAAPLIDRFNAALGQLAPIVGSTLTTGFAAALPVMNAFIDGLTPLMTGVQGFFTELQGGSGQFATFTAALMGGLGQLLPAFGRLLVALAPIGTALLTLLVPALISVADIISANVGPAFTALTGFMNTHGTAVRNVGIALVGLVVGVKVVSVVMAGFSAVMGVVGGVIKVFSAVLRGLSIVFRVVMVAWRLLSLAFAVSPFGVIIIGIGLLVAALVIAYQRSTTFRNIVNGAFNAVKAVIMSVVAAIALKVAVLIAAFNRAKAQAQSAMRAAGQAFNTFKSTVATAISGAMSTVAGIPGRIKGAVGNLSGLLTSAGHNVIMGLVNGIKGAIGAAASAAASAAKAVLNAAKAALGIHSPSRKFMEIGKQVNAGLVQGLEKNNRVIQASKNLAALVESKATPTLGNMELAFTGTSGTGFGGNNYNITVNAPVGSSSEEIGRTIAKHIKAYEKAGGR